MADHITITAEHDGSVETGDLRDSLTDLDVSVSSPVSPDGREVGTLLMDERVMLVVAGHDGDFTKQSQTALEDALAATDGVSEDSVSVTEGGYTPDE